MTTTPRQLRERFPYMFAGEHIGRTFYRGWFPVFAKLCEDVDELLGEDKRGFNWVQVKEKWGSARFYWESQDNAPNLRFDLMFPAARKLISVRMSDLDEPADPTQPPWLDQRIDALVREAERATVTQCIVCGQPGAVNEEQPWVLVLCQQHAAQRRLGKLDVRQAAHFPKEEL